MAINLKDKRQEGDASRGFTQFHFSRMRRMESARSAAAAPARHSRSARSAKSGAGFTLIIAIIFMSVMLLFGLALGSLGYKQQQLASSAIGSQYAFYAADGALECALNADQQNGGQPSLFTYPQIDPGVAPVMSCDGISAISSAKTWDAAKWVVTERVSLDSSTAHPHCADVTVYKYKVPQADGVTTYVFSQGYDIACALVGSGARFSARGLSAKY